MPEGGSTPPIKLAITPTSGARATTIRNRSVGPIASRKPCLSSGNSSESGSRLLEFTDSPVRGRLVQKSKSVLSFTISYESPTEPAKCGRPVSCLVNGEKKVCKNRVGPVKTVSSEARKSVGVSVEQVLVNKGVQCELLTTEKKDFEKLSKSSSEDRSDECNGNWNENGQPESPEKKARRNPRTKNYLHGNYTTLGYAEVERLFPERRVSVLVGTWNMNGKPHPLTLEDLILPTRLSTAPDVVVVCTQESYSAKFSWEVSLQETLGPDHVMLSSASLGTLHISIFLRRELIWVCSVPEDGSFSTRPGTKFRTKGGVAIGLSIFGTSFLFICSHLTAHTERLSDRVSDIRRISTGLDLPKLLPIKHRHRDVTLNYDCVFWAGDLNFRLASHRNDVIENVSNGWKLPETRAGAEMAQRLLIDDQLKRIMKNGEAFKGFEEGVISFPPTYKYLPGTSEFESTKDRTPAYTDRVLFKTKAGTDARCLQYDSVPNITTSDHKPVWGSFTVSVKPGDSKVPLAAGLFNRPVYIEGTKRWAEVGWARKGKLTNNGSMCVIQ